MGLDSHGKQTTTPVLTNALPDFVLRDYIEGRYFLSLVKDHGKVLQ